jgi:hypothetical protein
MQTIGFTRFKGLMTMVLIAVFLIGCGTVPKQEVRTYTDAFAHVKKATEAMLRQYDKDIKGDSSDSDNPEDKSASRYPAELPPVTLVDKSKTTNKDVLVRLNLLVQVDQYNKVLLAIANNEPFTQTHQLANQLGALLEKGIGIAGTSIGIPIDIMGPIIKAIKTAKTQAELIRAIRAAKVSQAAYDALTTKPRNEQDKEALAKVLEDPAQVECKTELQVACYPLITIMLELMQQDTETFFAARKNVVLARRNKEIAGDIGSLRRKLNGYLKERKSPTESKLIQERGAAELAFNTVLKETLEDKFQPLVFPSKDDGQPYNQESQKIVNLHITRAQELNQKDVLLAASLKEYIAALTQYRTLLITTNRYFNAIEEALERAPDLLGVDSRDADKIIPLAHDLINGSVDVRAALAAILITE